MTCEGEPEGDAAAIEQVARTQRLGRPPDLRSSHTGDTSYKTQCARLLRDAYTKRDVFVNAEIVKQFREVFEDLADPELDLDINTMLLRQEMNEFQEAFMTKLTDQAIRNWSPQRFGTMRDQIRFDQLKQRDPPAFDRLKDHLRTVKQDKQEPQMVRDRASWLLERAKQMRL